MVQASRQSNTRFNSQFTGAVPGTLEMAALEDLGPRAVYALKHMPLPILAAPIVGQIVEHNDKIEAENNRRLDLNLDLPQMPYLDPKHPVIDEKIAQTIVDQTCGLLRLDSVEEIDIKASLKPLHGAPSPRSIREQRKAMRRSGRWR